MGDKPQNSKADNFSTAEKPIKKGASKEKGNQRNFSGAAKMKKKADDAADS